MERTKSRARKSSGTLEIPMAKIITTKVTRNDHNELVSIINSQTKTLSKILGGVEGMSAKVDSLTTNVSEIHLVTQGIESRWKVWNAIKETKKNSPMFHKVIMTSILLIGLAMGLLQLNSWAHPFGYSVALGQSMHEKSLIIHQDTTSLVK